MATTSQLRRGKVLVRNTAALLLIAGTGYVVGATTRAPLIGHNAAAAPAQPVAQAPFGSRQPLGDDGDDLPDTLDWARSRSQYIEAPRECDANRGLVAECVFMD